eukprot:TRINITY_DN19941_c0_g1_i1.p1 TRINITY_DN19941_c0_g1~~TRINITY_DN19941_c0_g1_i1.p1  ORF type:complete len:492 (-),score=113.40 TRINITY_DN19941_c0_g1_i1:226-1701(-)
MRMMTPAPHKKACMLDMSSVCSRMSATAMLAIELRRFHCSCWALRSTWSTRFSSAHTLGMLPFVARSLTAMVDATGGGGYSHLLTGYIGTESFLRAVLEVVEKAKCTYVCDPVLGDEGNLYVPAGLIGIYRDEVLPKADILTPNQFEVEMLLGREVGSITTLEDACEAVDKLHSFGPSVVCMTTVDACASDREVAMLLSEKGRRPKWLLKLPRIQGGPFTGTGDLTAAMLLAWGTRHKLELPMAMEKAAAVVHGVLRRTMDPASRRPRRQLGDKSVPPELMLIASKREIEDPQVMYRCCAVWPKGTSPLRGVVFGLTGVLLLPELTHGGTEQLRDVLEAAACEQRLRPDARTVLASVKTCGLRAAVLAGRSKAAASEALTKALSCSSDLAALDPVLTQDGLAEHGVQAEPSAEPIYHICKAWDVKPDELLVVGSCADVVRCGREAGARTCFVLPGSTMSSNVAATAALADATISSLADLRRLLAGCSCDSA